MSTTSIAILTKPQNSCWRVCAVSTGLPLVSSNRVDDLDPDDSTTSEFLSAPLKEPNGDLYDLNAASFAT